MHSAPSVNDGTPPMVGNEHLLSWSSSIHQHPGDCWLEIPSRGSKAKMMVTTSNHLFVNMADFGDLEIEGDVLAAKRSHEDDDTSGGESDGTPPTWASTECDADIVPEKRRRRGAYHRPGPARKKKNPRAFTRRSLASQSKLQKLQQVATRGSGVSKTEWVKVCKAADKAISLLPPGGRTSDMAATFTSHRIGQHVFEIYAMEADDKCKSENEENEASSEDDYSTDEDRIERLDKNDLDHLETTTCRETISSAVR